MPPTTTPHGIVALAFPQAPHMLHPSGTLAIWFTEPAGMLAQLVVPTHGTRELVEWLARNVQPELARRFPGRDDLITVFDLRALTGRDADARSAMIELTKGSKDRVKRFVLVPSRNFNEALRRTLDITLSLLRVFGIEVELASSLGFVITQAGLKPLPK